MALQAITESCPNCSGSLEHKGNGVLQCPFCGSQFFSEERAKLESTLPNNDADYDDKEIDSEEIADIVFAAVSNYGDPDGYGVQILENGKKGLSKEDKARKNFDIPDDEEIYMIFDETMFGSCKTGYVITDYGIHLTDEDDELFFFAWDEFADYKLKQKDNITLKIGDVKTTLTGSNSAEYTYEMLRTIQDQL